MPQTTMTPKRLTDYADCAGCASKLAASELARVMDDLPVRPDDRVIVDYRTADDAGVFRWAAGPALVQTVDFFTPIVDDPYVFGEIAAANALSDVYAMGGVPRTALAIAALPTKDGPPADVIRAMFRGGSDMLKQAGVALLGGHTVSDPEIKFGYAVTGEVTPDRVLTNAGARPGDVLILTKPLGSGIIVRAQKFGRAMPSPSWPRRSRRWRRFNRAPIEVIRSLPPGVVHACTDVTGFGLIGHASEVAKASGVTLIIVTGSLPDLPRGREAGRSTPAVRRPRQRAAFRPRVDRRGRRSRAVISSLLDPQTSGCLLLALSPELAGQLRAALAGRDIEHWVIGRVESPGVPGRANSCGWYEMDDGQRATGRESAWPRPEPGWCPVRRPDGIN